MGSVVIHHHRAHCPTLYCVPLSDAVNPSRLSARAMRGEVAAKVANPSPELRKLRREASLVEADAAAEEPPSE